MSAFMATPRPSETADGAQSGGDPPYQQSPAARRPTIPIRSPRVATPTPPETADGVRSDGDPSCQQSPRLAVKRFLCSPIVATPRWPGHSENWILQALIASGECPCQSVT